MPPPDITQPPQMQYKQYDLTQQPDQPVYGTTNNDNDNDVEVSRKLAHQGYLKFNSILDSRYL